MTEHLIRSINDPEHPLTLEQLNVVEQSLVEVDDTNNYVKIQFTPTIPHCSMATLIGLAIRVQLLRSLPDRFKVLNSKALFIAHVNKPILHIVYCILDQEKNIRHFTYKDISFFTLLNVADLLLCIDLSMVNIYLFIYFSQVDISITPGTHASEDAGTVSVLIFFLFFFSP